jgi:hypothetical protein
MTAWRESAGGARVKNFNGALDFAATQHKLNL